MAIISALSNLLKDVMKAVQAVCYKDIITNKSSFKLFTNLQKPGIKGNKEK
jgi:hypothetical protein